MALVPALSSCGDRHGGRCATRYPSAPQGRAALAPAACRREPVSAQTTGLVRRTPSEAPPRHQRHAADACDTNEIHWLAAAADDCAARHTCALAPRRLSAVLALEISPAWATAHFSGLAAVDRGDGESKPDMGEERIAAELLLKLGISLSARTIRRYMRRRPSPHPGSRTQAYVPAQACPRRPRV